MPALAPADLTALRSRPIGRDWRLYIFQAAILWQADIGGAPAQGDRTLSFVTTAGNPADMIAGMTIRAFDVGGALKDPSKVRFKSQAAGVVTIAENAVPWVNGDIIQGWRLFEIWPRIPYINPAGVQFKDRDIAWASDAQAQPPKANAGPPAVVDLPAGGTVDIVFKDEGSFVCPSGGAVASHLWAPIGGAPAVVAGALNANTVTLRYNTAGYYYVSLTVTDANAQTGVVYVPVIIDPGTYRRRSVLAASRNWDGRGWALGRRIVGLATTAYDNTWYDGAPCFLVADTAQTPAGAFADNRATLRWAGWLIQDDTQRDAYSRAISFQARSSAHVLSNVPAFAVGLRSDAAPADWYEFSDLSVDSVVYLLLRWHSTVCQVCDYHPTGEWDTRERPGENCEVDDILSQVDLVLAAAKANLRCDRQGILRAMRHEWFLSAGEQAARATVLTLAHSDIQQATYGPHFHRSQFREARLDGVDAAGNPYLSGAPGSSPLDGGRPMEKKNLAPLSQAELNQWAGQELAFANYRASASLRMAGEYDCVDPALGEYVAGTLSTFDTRIPDGPYSVVGVRFEDDHGAGVTMGEWRLLPSPGAFPSEERDIPIEPPPPPADPLPDDGYPDLFPPVGTGKVVGWAGVGGFFYTVESFEAVPTWNKFTTGIGDDTFLPSLCADPIRPTYAAVIDNAGDVYITDNWRGVTNWSLALVGDANDGGASGTDARARIATAIGETYANTTDVLLTLVASFAGGADEAGTLLVVAQYRIPGGAGVRNKTLVLRSLDWGTTWTVGGGITGVDLFGTTYNSWEVELATTAVSYGPGVLAHDGTYLFMVAESFYEGGGTNKSCLQRSADWGDTWLGVAIEGGGAALNPSQGPSAGECDSSGKLYLARWLDAGTLVHWIASSIDLGVTITNVKNIAANDGYCYGRKSLKILEDDTWAALQVITAGSETSDVKLELGGALTYTFTRTIRTIHGFELEADVMYALRSHKAAEDASPTNPQVFYLSQDKGVSWDDISGNLYALGGRGGVAIVTDWSDD